MNKWFQSMIGCLVRRFLLHTAILERLCAPLCDAVVGEDSNAGSNQQMLEFLEEANLFVVPLDDERCWYRYHRLFADLLRTWAGIAAVMTASSLVSSTAAS